MFITKSKFVSQNMVVTPLLLLAGLVKLCVRFLYLEGSFERRSLCLAPRAFVYAILVGFP